MGSATKLPEVVEQFSSLDEYRAYLYESFQSLPLWGQLAEDNLRMQSFGYEPDHDVTVVTFSPGNQISVYLEQDQMDMRGRSAYAVRVGNHDQVLLPLEPIFHEAGIEYAWDEYSGILEIFGMANEIVLEAGQRGFSTNPLSAYHPPLAYAADKPTLLERRDSGLYVNTLLFSFLTQEEVSDEDSPWSWAITVNPLTPLIYHDLHKVVLVTNARINYPNYQNKRMASIAQFHRADFPIHEPISVVLNEMTFAAFSANTDITVLHYDELILEEVIFSSAPPYLEVGRYDDYVMLPLVEVFEMLGFAVTWDDQATTAYVEIDGVIHAISPDIDLSLGIPAFATTAGLTTEIAPTLVDDVLYISHADISMLLMQSGIIMHMNRQLSQLIISVMTAFE